jgi:hypothetical protein
MQRRSFSSLLLRRKPSSRYLFTYAWFSCSRACLSSRAPTHTHSLSHTRTRTRTRTTHAHAPHARCTIHARSRQGTDASCSGGGRGGCDRAHFKRTRAHQLQELRESHACSSSHVLLTVPWLQPTCVVGCQCQLAFLLTFSRSTVPSLWPRLLTVHEPGLLAFGLQCNGHSLIVLCW